jgi:hypothetical protein
MYKVICFSALLFLLAACASSHKQQSPPLPAWVDQPMSECMESMEICAVGEGPNRDSAETKARESLAKYFETRVSSTSIYSMSIKDTTAGNKEEGASNRLEEATQEILKGVRVVAAHTREDRAWILMSMDKRKGAGILAREMDVLDEEMKAHLERKKGASFTKIEKILPLRRALDERYSLLAGREYPEKVTMKDVNDWRKARSLKGITVSLNITTESTLERVRPFVIKALIDREYKVRESPESAQYLIEGKAASSKEHLNIKGHEKYSFKVDLVVKNASGEKKGALLVKAASVGRSQEQCLERALPEIEKIIEEQIDELNMD